MFVPKDLSDELKKESEKVLSLKRPWLQDSLMFEMKPQLGVGDYVSPERYDLGNPKTRIIYLTITPSEESKYWRCGFRFSKNGFPLMLPQRTATNYPLWHLTRNEDAPLVGTTYCNENCQEDTTEGMLISPYKDTPISVFLYSARLDKESVLRLVICHDERVIYVKNLPMELHRYVWLSSWADQFDYKINAVLSVK